MLFCWDMVILFILPGLYHYSGHGGWRECHLIQYTTNCTQSNSPHCFVDDFSVLREHSIFSLPSHHHCNSHKNSKHRFLLSTLFAYLCSVLYTNLPTLLLLMYFYMCVYIQKIWTWQTHWQYGKESKYQIVNMSQVYRQQQGRE